MIILQLSKLPVGMACTMFLWNSKCLEVGPKQFVHVCAAVCWHPACNAVWDVCDWVDGIGLPQYRKRFMHHCIDGRLLLKLKEDVLKTELGIGPLVRE